MIKIGVDFLVCRDNLGHIVHSIIVLIYFFKDPCHQEVLVNHLGIILILFHVLFQQFQTLICLVLIEMINRLLKCRLLCQVGLILLERVKIFLGRVDSVS